MPKTNLKGGKKKKRGKNGIVENKRIIYPEDNELYGQISKVLGNNRFYVRCFNDDKRTELLCILRGSMRKRVWVNVNDIVIVSIRSFEVKKADIIHKYTTDEANILKKMNKIPSIEFVNGSLEQKSDVNFLLDDTGIPSDNDDHKDTESTINNINTAIDLDVSYSNNTMIPEYDTESNYESESESESE